MSDKDYKAPNRRAYEQDKPLFQIMDEGGGVSPSVQGSCLLMDDKNGKAPNRRAYEQDKPLFQMMDERGDALPSANPVSSSAQGSCLLVSDKNDKAPNRKAYEQGKPRSRMMDENGDVSPSAPPVPSVHPVFAKQHEVRKGSQVQALPEDFAPELKYIQFLQLHHGISPEFTFDQLPDFKLYWLETGEARKAWQNRFKTHVIYQWRRQQSEGGRESYRTTAEKLTDTSWSDQFRINLDED